MSRQLTTKEFIEKAILIHSDKYDYSLVDYKKSKLKVIIICKEHGEFKQTPNIHLNNHGCPECKSKSQRNHINDFIEKSNKIHNNFYDYSLVDYKNANKLVTIICPIHGEFKQTPNNHLTGKSGCSKCKNNRKLTTLEFINRSKDIHNNKYDYSLVDYKNSIKKVTIICPIHGEFKQKPHKHLLKCGCPQCRESKGEKNIINYLNINNIKFETYKKFEGCRYKYPLKFDFYLIDYNICIEFDGIQHFKSVNYWGGEEDLKLRKIRDNIKTNYCKENDITLIRIKYDEIIEEKLKNILFL